MDVMPTGACDAHVHLIGDEFPLSLKAVEQPPEGSLEVWLERYRAHLQQMGCTRGVIVHSILYGGDNSVTLEAVRRMGPGFVGVCLVTDGATEAQIAALAEAGCRAVRLNYVHGGLLSWEGMTRLAPMLAAYGMHVEMLAHAHLHLEELAPQVASLPVEVVFDHCAWPDLSFGVETPGLAALRRLLAEREAWVKLSAPYRYDGTPDLFRSLAEAGPDRILWGSDWPHLMLGGVPMPDTRAGLNMVLEALPEAELRHKLFVDNPGALYRFP